MRFNLSIATVLSGTFGLLSPIGASRKGLAIFNLRGAQRRVGGTDERDLLTPVHRLDLDGADRLNAVLMRAFAIGEFVDPLNSQRPQLESLSLSLEHLFQDLGREIAKLRATTDGPRSEQDRLCRTLERLSTNVAALIETARSDPPP